MKRTVALLCIFVLTLSCFSFSVHAEETEEKTLPTVTSEAAIVMDAETGAILYQKDITKKLGPADTAQLMTVLLGLESGKGEDTVKIPQSIVDSIDREGTHISLTTDEEVRIKDLLYATMLASASDAAKAVALGISGTEEAFAEKMTERMKALGAVNTVFANADGSPAKENYTTAQDLALLVKEGIQNKEFREMFGLTSYTMGPTNKNTSGRSFTTLCLLMKNSDMNVKYEYTTGGKGGWNKEADYALVSTARKDGRTLICVILGAEKSKQRYEETIALLDYVFATYRNVEIPGSLLPATEIPVMKDGQILRKITVSLPAGACVSTNLEFQENTLTLSSLPEHLTEGEAVPKITVSAKDKDGNTVALGQITLQVEMGELLNQGDAGGEKTVPLSLGAKIWKVVRVILIVLLCFVGGLILICGLLFLSSYLQRRKRQLRKRRRLKELQQEEETAKAEQTAYSGRRHRKSEE